MKKLLGIVVLVLLWCNVSNALEVTIACDIKKVDDDLYAKNLGMPGQTKYFEITKHDEAWSNWDQYNDRFINWHYVAGVDNKYIKFYKFPGSRSDTDDIQVIDRETGIMVTQNYLGQNKRYNALCDKIEKSALPSKTAKQKF